MKPGYLTTEFYVTLLTQLWAVVGLLGIFDVSDADANAAIKSASIIAAAVASAYYAHSRGQAKKNPPKPE